MRLGKTLNFTPMVEFRAWLTWTSISAPHSFGHCLWWRQENQKLVSYGDVQHLTGLLKPAVGHVALGPITHYCQRENLPWLTAIVVEEAKGLPGEPFMKAAKREYGKNFDIHTMQARVFVFDWFKRRAPTPDELKRADESHADQWPGGQEQRKGP